jgi:integrase/recombinase XerD
MEHKKILQRIKKDFKTKLDAKSKAIKILKEKNKHLELQFKLVSKELEALKVGNIAPKKKKTTAINKPSKNIEHKDYLKLMTFTQENSLKRRPNTVHYLKATFILLYYTGVRINEVQQLKIRNIKELINNNTTTIYSSKTNSYRDLYATSKAFKDDLIRLYPEIDNADDDSLIIKNSNYSGGEIARVAYTKTVNTQIQTALNSKDYTSHGFRHSLITRLSEHGESIEAISQFIGHSSVKTTQNYIQTSQNKKENLGKLV